MPIDFDDDQMLNEEPKTQAEPNQPVEAQALPKPKRVVRPAQEIEDELELKMAKMQYYWDVVGNPIFPDTDDEIAIEVENEIHAFVRGKLEELMGRKKGRKQQAVVSNRTRRPSVERTPVVIRRAGVKTRTNRAPGSAVKTPDVPKGASSTGEAITQSIIDPNGFEMKRIYRQMLDRNSGRKYYLCYTLDSNGTEVGDGNKYELTVNANGGQYFRVISEQTLPEGITSVKPMTLAAISQASEQHAHATLSAIRNNKNASLLNAAIQTALTAPKSE